MTQLIIAVETQPFSPGPLFDVTPGSDRIPLSPGAFMSPSENPWFIVTFNSAFSPVFISEELRDNDQAISAQHKSLGQGEEGLRAPCSAGSAERLRGGSGIISQSPVPKEASFPKFPKGVYGLASALVRNAFEMGWKLHAPLLRKNAHVPTKLCMILGVHGLP